MRVRVAGTGSVAALALALAPAVTAAAATLATDSPCYLEERTVAVTGAGFTPNAPYTATLDGAPLGDGTTDATGGFTASFKSAKLASTTGERTFTLQVADGANTASAQFRVTQFLADFQPSSGDPKTLKVRFQVFGFGPGSTVYVHYVRPRGRHRKTVRLGRARGPCGSIPTTRLRRLFPFAAERGVWKLQFTTRRTYRKTNKPRIVIPVRIRRIF